MSDETRIETPQRMGARHVIDGVDLQAGRAPLIAFVVEQVVAKLDDAGADLSKLEVSVRPALFPAGALVVAAKAETLEPNPAAATLKP